MALVSGTRLGQFEILAPLGAGGMGEVYRARDTPLGRDVALKLSSGVVTEAILARPLDGGPLMTLARIRDLLAAR